MPCKNNKYIRYNLSLLSQRTQCTPLSCMDILRCDPSASSGYYQIQAANGSLVQVYCDLEGTNCGGEGGWTRVFQLNATDPSSQCPAGFSLTTPDGVSICTRTDTAAGCTGTSTDNIAHSYTQVCGLVRGYSFGGPDAFGAFGRTASEPLSGNYVDGVSITYGTPLNHLWTYAAGNSETGEGTADCPCNSNGDTSAIPSYIGSDYYCEARSGTGSDPLWDGMRCEGDEGQCCIDPTLPWFIKNVLSSTDDNIMIRVCLDENSGNENIGLELVEIYIR